MKIRFVESKMVFRVLLMHAKVTIRIINLKMINNFHRENRNFVVSRARINFGIEG